MTDPDGTSVILATKTKKDVSHFRTSSQEVTDFFVWETSTRVKLMGLPPTHTHTQKKTFNSWDSLVVWSKPNISGAILTVMLLDRWLHSFHRETPQTNAQQRAPGHLKRDSSTFSNKGYLQKVGWQLYRHEQFQSGEQLLLLRGLMG